MDGSCLSFSFDHCVVCPSSIYRFWLPVWYLQTLLVFACLMVFYATFNNISVTGISWWSVLLVEETRGPGENHQPPTTDLSQVADKLYHIMLYNLPWSRFELTTAVVTGTDCIGSCKSHYYRITARFFLW